MGFTDLLKRTNQVFNADEAPEGVRKITRIIPEEDSGDVFGFGNFGFDEPVNDRGATLAAASADAGSGAWDQRPADGEAFPSHNNTVDIALLDQAATAPAMNASDLVRQVKRLVNYEGASYYEIPADPARYGKMENAELSSLVSNYLVLLSGNLGDYANDALEPTAIKTTVQLRTTGDTGTKAVMEQLRAYIAAHFPDTVRVRIGGPALVDSSLSGLVVESQIISLAVSIFMVFFIIALSNRSAIAGFVGILPLSISILINFAAMGFLGIKLNLGTSLVASLSVGVGVDYAIHFIDAYKREYLAANGGEDFLRRAFATSGKAIIINAISVGAGFAVLAFSRFVILASLGLLMTLTMFTSALISLTLIPATLTVLKPKFIYGKDNAGR
jgi:predicted RND superfamily exporter protein